MVLVSDMSKFKFWPEGWREFDDAESSYQGLEALKGLHPNHALFGLRASALAGRDDRDDMVLELGDGRIVEVRFGEVGPDGLNPHALFYEKLWAWVDAATANGSDIEGH